MNKINKVGVIGCGTIGIGWATFFALKGLKVNIYDKQIKSFEQLEEKIKTILDFFLKVGEIDETQSIEAMKNVTIFRDLEQCINGVDFVQESIFENYDAKKEVYSKLDQVLSENIIIASSSSGLLMTEIQKAVNKYPQRCVIGHPINPVYLIPLVEIVPGEKTIEKTIKETKAFYESIGKVPVVLKKEVPGYLENRLTAALWREAIDLVMNDVASVEDVDKAIWAGPGLRYALIGPHLIYHLGGGEGGIKYFIEHLGEAFTQWWEDMRCWTKFPEGAAQRLNDEIIESMKGKNIKDICFWRDKKLIELIKIVDLKKNYNL